MSCHVLSVKMFLRQTSEHIQAAEGTFMAHAFLGAFRALFSYNLFLFWIKTDDLFISLYANLCSRFKGTIHPFPLAFLCKEEYDTKTLRPQILTT